MRRSTFYTRRTRTLEVGEVTVFVEGADEASPAPADQPGV